MPRLPVDFTAAQPISLPAPAPHAAILPLLPRPTSGLSAENAATVPKKRGRKPKPKSEDAPGAEEKPKKPRVPRGTGPRALQRKAEKLEQEARAAAAAHATAQAAETNFATMPPPSPKTLFPNLAKKVSQNKEGPVSPPKNDGYAPRAHFDPVRAATMSEGSATDQAASVTQPPKKEIGAFAVVTDTPTKPKDAMDVDTGSPRIENQNKSPKNGRSVARAPKVPVASGSGLLSGAVFGQIAGDANAEIAAPTVVIDIPLNGEPQYINFLRLAEEKYGFDALHPRLAAQRERLARVSAAGTALKETQTKDSNDDQSVDLSNDEAEQSNVEMQESADAVNAEMAADGPQKKIRRKRVMKEDMYDIDDDFVDDTELAWEEQAAAAKDGFFVYCGPLVAVGQEPEIERSNPEAPRRGRGGGRGRGSRGGRGGRGGSTRETKAKVKEKVKSVPKPARKIKPDVPKVPDPTVANPIQTERSSSPLSQPPEEVAANEAQRSIPTPSVTSVPDAMMVD